MDHTESLGRTPVDFFGVEISLSIVDNCRVHRGREGTGWGDLGFFEIFKYFYLPSLHWNYT